MRAGPADGARPVSEIAHPRAAIEQACVSPGRQADGETARTARNDLVATLMLAIDRAHHDYERQLFDVGRSGSPGAVIDTRTRRGRDALVHQMIGVLHMQMRANRATQRTAILEQLARPVSEWPTCAAIRDLMFYERAGSFDAALARVTATAAAAATAENEAAEARAARVLTTVPQ